MTRTSSSPLTSTVMRTCVTSGSSRSSISGADGASTVSSPAPHRPLAKPDLRTGRWIPEWYQAIATAGQAQLKLTWVRIAAHNVQRKLTISDRSRRRCSGRKRPCIATATRSGEAVATVRSRDTFPIRDLTSSLSLMPFLHTTSQMYMLCALRFLLSMYCYIVLFSSPHLAS